MTTATMTASTTTTPAIEVLSLLHQYQSLHSTANDDLKSSIFNITRARRGRSYQVGGGFGGVEFSSDDVREELRAQALLEWKKEDGGEPTLVDDDDAVKDGDSQNGSSGDRFVLHFDGMKALAQQQRGEAESSQSQQNTMSADNKENEGLRQRRGGNPNPTDESDKNNKWTVEEPDNNDNDIQDEEERLRNADPLNLFGVPPPALRVSQAKSRSALAYYVEVANLAREIMKITSRHDEE